MKKFLLFLTVLACTVCFFVLTVCAGEIYSDFTQNGINGENPIFTFLGYAVDEQAGNICVEYNVDIDALEDYENKVGKKLEYGFVVTRKDCMENGKPLDKNGKPTGANKDKIFTVDFSKNTAIISVILTGLEPETYGEEIVLSLYIKGDSNVKYVTKNESTEEPTPVSYEKVLGPKEVKIDGFVYSTDGVTEPAYDRIKQKNYSDSVYNTGSSASLSSIRTKAALIALGGRLINMPAASKFMSHYLDNTGTEYTIDVAGFLSDDSGALKSRNTAINRALRAAEALATEGKAITINQLTEGHPMQNSLATQNWQYSVGSYFDDVDVIDLTVTEVNGVKTYTANIKYIVTDFYNWDTNDYNKFKQIVSPHDLHELHKGGQAREFMSYGEITYKNITWTQGQTVDQIAGLK